LRPIGPHPGCFLPVGLAWGVLDSMNFTEMDFYQVYSQLGHQSLKQHLKSEHLLKECQRPPIHKKVSSEEK
jgi:hypothetical protein